MLKLNSTMFTTECHCSFVLKNLQCNIFSSFSWDQSGWEPFTFFPAQNSLTPQLSLMSSLLSAKTGGSRWQEPLSLSLSLCLWNTKMYSHCWRLDCNQLDGWGDCTRTNCTLNVHLASCNMDIWLLSCTFVIYTFLQEKRCLSKYVTITYHDIICKIIQVKVGRVMLVKSDGKTGRGYRCSSGYFLWARLDGLVWRCGREKEGGREGWGRATHFTNGNQSKS